MGLKRKPPANIMGQPQALKDGTVIYYEDEEWVTLTGSFTADELRGIIAALENRPNNKRREDKSALMAPTPQNMGPGKRNGPKP